jgi:tetratricopeptide (TPR) repeat protein
MLNDSTRLSQYVQAACRGLALVAAVLISAAALSGCSTLDPTGEWRGLDRVQTTGGRADPPQPLAEQAAPYGPHAAGPTVSTPAAARPAAADSASAGRRPDLQRENDVRGADESLESLYSRAEAQYRDRRHAEAQRDFERVLKREPRALHAWFRMGNLHHARGDLAAAVHAYRKVIELTPMNAIEHDSREKALANLAILGLEQARVALERLNERHASDAARGRVEALTPLFEQRQAAVQAELARFAPRVVQPTDISRHGRSGEAGGMVLRIESHPPVNAFR